MPFVAHLKIWTPIFFSISVHSDFWKTCCIFCCISKSLKSSTFSFRHIEDVCCVSILKEYCSEGLVWELSLVMILWVRFCCISKNLNSSAFFFSYMEDFLSRISSGKTISKGSFLKMVSGDCYWINLRSEHDSFLKIELLQLFLSDFWKAFCCMSKSVLSIHISQSLSLVMWYIWPLISQFILETNRMIAWEELSLVF